MFDKLTDIMGWGHTLSQLREVALQRTIEKRVELFESCLSSSFSCVLEAQTWLCPPTSDPTITYLHPCTLVLKHSGKHLRNVPHQSLHVPQSTQGLLTDTRRQHHHIFLLLQDLIILKRNLSFSLSWFTKLLQNRCSQFWKIHIQQRCLHLRNHPISLPNLPGYAVQNDSPRLFWFWNCWWRRSPLFSAYHHSILIVSSEHSNCTQNLSQRTWMILLRLFLIVGLSTMHVLLDWSCGQ